VNCFTLLELKPKMIYQRYHCRLEATVLKSKVATDVSLTIMRTFVRLKNQSVPYFQGNFLLKQNRYSLVLTSSSDLKNLKQTIKRQGNFYKKWYKWFQVCKIFKMKQKRELKRLGLYEF